MRNDETFLRTILANPNDTSLPLVYADWLEERGDPRAASIRQHPEIYGFLARLQNAQQSPFNVIEESAAQGRFGYLATLAVVLEGHRNDEPMKAVFARLGDSTLHHIVRVLAHTDGNASLDALLQAYAATPGRVSWGREVASRIASGQSPETPLSLFDRELTNADLLELRSCLLQELVLRGISVRNVRQPAGHPLARLPLRVLDIESEVTRLLPHYNLRGSSSQGLPNLAMETELVSASIETDIVPVAEVDSVEAIGSAVRVWTTHSNGMCETKVLQTERPVGGDGLSLSFLRSLRLDCLGEDSRAQVVPASRAFALLFGAAFGGGAYGSGLQGAYGRLAAWESIGGLTGADANDTIESVEKRAKRASINYFQ